MAKVNNTEWNVIHKQESIAVSHIILFCKENKGKTTTIKLTKNYTE